MKNETYKYIICGTERSGSTLLSAVLANAGANFGMSLKTDWNRNSGAFEHTTLINMIKYFKRKELYGNFSDRLKLFFENKIIQQIKNGLGEEVTYLKYPIYSEQQAYYVRKSGFQPRLIMTIRKFEEVAQSQLYKHGGNYLDLKNYYIDTLSTCILELKNYGGCIISYDELTNLNERKWADRITQITGLSKNLLIEKRDTLLKPIKQNNQIDFIDEDCEKLYQQAIKISSKTFEGFKYG